MDGSRKGSPIPREAMVAKPESMMPTTAEQRPLRA
jgi:hypothetical protein